MLNLSYSELYRHYSSTLVLIPLNAHVGIVTAYFLLKLFRYAAILFKKQRYVSGQHRLNIKIVCKDNFKYEVQERAATSAVSLLGGFWYWVLNF